MIVTHGLTKRFGRFVAVDGVDLDVREGDRYGFLGPNGSGKTTTVRMLLGLVLPSSGEIEVLGRPMPHQSATVLPQIGALIEGPAAYGHLNARTNLSLLDGAGPATEFANRRNRRERIDDVLDLVGLAGVGRKPVGQFSLGMRQRLGLAAALLGRPKLLILDEPTNGLDPQGIHEIRDLLLRLNAAGTTVFLSSHLLSEIEQLCDRVGILSAGRLVWQGDLDALRGPTGRALVRVSDPVAAVSLLAGKVVNQDGERLVVTGTSVEDLTRLLVEKGIGVREAAPERHDLEEAVLRLTGPSSDRVDASPRAVDVPGGTA